LDLTLEIGGVGLVWLILLYENPSILTCKGYLKSGCSFFTW
jgi:hypothetical protein